MASLDEQSYRREVANFRRTMTKSAEAQRGPNGTPSSLYSRGVGWYAVMAELGLKLYCTMENLYLKAFLNPGAAYRFLNTPNPKSVEPYGGIINAVQLDFLESYNSSGGRDGLGFAQTDQVTVTIQQLSDALTKMGSANFGNLSKDDQRRAVGRVVIGLIEGARFKDVEDHVVAGTALDGNSRNWPNHDPKTLMIGAPA